MARHQKKSLVSTSENSFPVPRRRRRAKAFRANGQITMLVNRRGSDRVEVTAKESQSTYLDIGDGDEIGSNISKAGEKLSEGSHDEVVAMSE